MKKTNKMLFGDLISQNKGSNFHHASVSTSTNWQNQSPLVEYVIAIVLDKYICTEDKLFISL